MKNEDVDVTKLEAGDYCRKGCPKCFCAVGWPLERQCPDCRGTKLTDEYSYCGCPPREDLFPESLATSPSPIKDLNDAIDKIAYENHKRFEEWCVAFVDRMSKEFGIPKDVLLRRIGAEMDPDYDPNPPEYQTEAIEEPRPSCTFLRDNIETIKTVEHAERLFGLGHPLYSTCKRLIEAGGYIVIECRPQK